MSVRDFKAFSAHARFLDAVRQHLRGHWAAYIIGLVAAMTAAAWSWVPSLWYDEAATVTSAQRSWTQLWAELHTVDAVHGLYYAIMHLWFDVVGYTPFSLRLPSAIAVGIAAGLTVALGRVLDTARLGIVAGLTFTVLPRVQWAGSEGRPYAMIAALSVGLALVAVRNVGEGRAGKRWWIAYSMLACLAIVMNIYLALAVLAHGIALICSHLIDTCRHPHATPPARPFWSRGSPFQGWLLASGSAFILTAPFVAIVASQSAQVGWISEVGDRTINQVFSMAWFGWSIPYASVAWGLMTVSAVLTLRNARAGGRVVKTSTRTRAFWWACALVVVPTGMLLAATATGMHLYSPKYASLSLPFVAILIGLALVRIQRQTVLAAVMICVIALSIPTSTAVRAPEAKQGTTWDRAAAFVTDHRDRSGNEGVVFGSLAKHPTATSHVLRIAYPKAFTGMRDVGVSLNGARNGKLWNRTGPVQQVIPSRLDGISEIWSLGAPARSIEPEIAITLHRHSFQQQGQWVIGDVIITRYRR